MNNKKINAEVVELFPTPLYTSKIENIDSSIYLDREYQRMRPANNGFSSLDYNILDNPKLSYLKEQITSHIDVFTRQYLKVDNSVDFYITNSWIIKHQKGDWSQTHRHCNSLISGILYLKVDENSGAIVFHKHSGYMNLFPDAISVPFAEYNTINGQSYKYLPSDGDLILFPSHLNHGVMQSESDNHRYCLAFNVFVKGQMGEDSLFDKLIL